MWCNTLVMYFAVAGDGLKCDDGFNPADMDAAFVRMMVQR
jgi:hypothetical protein